MNTCSDRLTALSPLHASAATSATLPPIARARPGSVSTAGQTTCAASISGWARRSSSTLTHAPPNHLAACRTYRSLSTARVERVPSPSDDRSQAVLLVRRRRPHFLELPEYPWRLRHGPCRRCWRRPVLRELSYPGRARYRCVVRAKLTSARCVDLVTSDLRLPGSRASCLRHRVHCLISLTLALFRSHAHALRSTAPEEASPVHHRWAAVSLAGWSTRAPRVRLSACSASASPSVLSFLP